MPEANSPLGGRIFAIAADPAPRRHVVVRLDGAGERATRTYAWAGDMRTLLEAIERAVLQAGGDTVGDEQAPPRGPAGGHGDATPMPVVGAPVTLELLERKHIEAVLAASSTLDAAARTLGIDSSTLYRKRKAYRL